MALSQPDWNQDRHSIQPHLIVVDDDVITLDCLASLLRRHFPLASIVPFVNPAQALVQLRDGPCDVVLTDFNMPGMDGLCLLRAAREYGSTASFILMTGNSTADMLTEGLRLGLFALMNKPLDCTSLVSLVRQACECHRLRQEVTALRQRLADAGLEWIPSVGLHSDEEFQPLLPF